MLPFSLMDSFPAMACAILYAVSVYRVVMMIGCLGWWLRLDEGFAGVEVVGEGERFSAQAWARFALAFGTERVDLEPVGRGSVRVVLFGVCLFASPAGECT